MRNSESGAIEDRHMRLSRYFLPLLKETPKEAEIVSHKLMLRAGHDQAAGRRHLFLAAARASRCSNKIDQDHRGGAEPLGRHRSC